MPLNWGVLNIRLGISFCFEKGPLKPTFWVPELWLVIVYARKYQTFFVFKWRVRIDSTTEFAYKLNVLYDMLCICTRLTSFVKWKFSTLSYPNKVMKILEKGRTCRNSILKRGVWLKCLCKDGEIFYRTFSFCSFNHPKVTLKWVSYIKCSTKTKVRSWGLLGIIWDS